MRTSHRFTLLCLTTILFFSCNKEHTQTIANENDDPLSLSFTRRGSEITLSWNNLDEDHFERYLILRSIDTIPLSPEPDMNLVIWDSNRQWESTFLDRFPPFNVPLYYVLYAELEDRFVVSAMVFIPSSGHSLPFCYLVAQHIPGSDYLVMVTSDATLAKYNFKTQEIEQEVDLISSDFYPGHISQIKIGDAGNGMEVFFIATTTNFDYSLYILDVADLTVKETKLIVPTHIGGLTISPKGFIIFNSGSIVSTYRRSDLSLIDMKELPYLSPNNISLTSCLLQSTANQLHFFGGNRYYYTQEFSYEGFFINDATTEEFLFSFGKVKSEIAVSTFGNYLIAGDKTFVLDSDMNIIKSYPIPEFATRSAVHLFDANNEDYLYFNNDSGIIRLTISTGETKTMLPFVGAKNLFDLGGEILAINNFPNPESCSGIFIIEK